MGFLKTNWFNSVVIFTFFILIFTLTIKPSWDPDLFLHTKSGEIIAQFGIIHHDVFSYVTDGREWFSYEWLFQLLLYWFVSLFGLESVTYLNALLSILMLSLLMVILARMFKVRFLTSTAICFFFYASAFEFLSPRPHLLAYNLLTAEILLILLIYQIAEKLKLKKLLFFAFCFSLLTYAWGNIHGSVFLSFILLFGYAAISLFNFFQTKEKLWIYKFKLFSVFGIICALVSVFPPLWTTQYRLLYIFFQNRDLISSFIAEWSPLSANPAPFYYYSTSFAIVMILFVTIYLKIKKRVSLNSTLPLIPILITPYLATRNTIIGFIVLTIIIGTLIQSLKSSSIFSIKKSAYIASLILLVVISSYIFYQKSVEDSFMNFYYPVQAVDFLKKNHINGNMFNEYGYGGFLLYSLYPDYKVFFDGRTDLYLCCEMKEVMELAYQKNLPDEQYKVVLNKLWDKYNVSFFIARTEKNTLLRKIMRLMQDDQENWSLVYWDDRTQIFVRKDGKNEAIIKDFGTSAATPYNKNPYRENMAEQALGEYQKMASIQDSGKTQSIIGLIYMQQKKYLQARETFKKAIAFNPNLESPYMNLAELAAAEGDLNTAISLYQKARSLTPDRGLIYIRLGQITLQNTGDLNLAKQIWQEGLNNTIDTEAKNKLEQLLSGT